MAKLKFDFSLLPVICIFFFLLILSACSSIKMVTIKNNTDKNIVFQGHFFTKTKNQHNLEFNLKPGDINSWRYEIGAFENDVLDKGLNKIILSDSKGCSVTLERNLIEELAVKNGMWEIFIDKNVMMCK